MKEKQTLSKYLKNPCGTCANAFWKNDVFAKPAGMQIIHANCVKEFDLSWACVGRAAVEKAKQENGVIAVFGKGLGRRIKTEVF